jgi:hypothetical protein
MNDKSDALDPVQCGVDKYAYVYVYMCVCVCVCVCVCGFVCIQGEREGGGGGGRGRGRGRGREGGREKSEGGRRGEKERDFIRKHRATGVVNFNFEPPSA